MTEINALLQTVLDNKNKDPSFSDSMECLGETVNAIDVLIVKETIQFLKICKTSNDGCGFLSEDVDQTFSEIVPQSYECLENANASDKLGSDIINLIGQIANFVIFAVDASAPPN